jgi:hypothetical protein
MSRNVGENQHASNFLNASYSMVVISGCEGKFDQPQFPPGPIVSSKPFCKMCRNARTPLELVVPVSLSI